MKIGRYRLKHAMPEDLDQRVMGLTGCSLPEIREMLPTATVASFVAAALLPFLQNPPALPDLAAEISRHGLARSRRSVLSLYRDSDRRRPAHNKGPDQ